jgi:imidazolonepropionase-like amidohydrolase
MHRISCILCLLFSLSLSAQSWKPVNGNSDARNHYTAFTNATIYVKPGTWIKQGTLLIRKGQVEAVGKELNIPENTVIHNMEGKYIFPSFIDLYTEYGLTGAELEESAHSPKTLEGNKDERFYWNDAVHVEFAAKDHFNKNKAEAKKYREMGFGMVATHRKEGVHRGEGALVCLGEGEENQMVQAQAAMYYSFDKGKSKQLYPTSLIGAIALIRQLHYDAAWYAQGKSEYNQSLEVLNQSAALPKVIAVDDPLSVLRADKIGDEFNFQFIVKASGREYEQLQEIKKSKAPLIVPVAYPLPYDVEDPLDAQRVSLQQLKQWELAPYNLKYLAAEGLRFAVTAEGHKKAKDFTKNLSTSLKRGLAFDSLLKSLTETPARLLNVWESTGSLEPQKMANFLICSDTLFKEGSFIYSNWVRGKEYLVNPVSSIDWEGSYSLNIKKSLQFELELKREGRKWSGEVSPKGEKEKYKLSFSEEQNRLQLSFEVNGRLYRLSGSTNDSLSRIWSGRTIVDGKWENWAAIKKLGDKTQKAAKKEQKDSMLYEAKLSYPLTAYGWDSVPEKGASIVFRNATVWTNEKEGILKNHDVVIHAGKILMVGYKINLEVMFPELLGKLKEIDLNGKHLTSGLIDEHSHIAVDGGINEAGKSIAAEVRIGDAINSSDINIYRQLAGGLTAAQLLHGSADPIGGQSALIKLRWGKTAEDLKIDSAANFIKFALGENVKQSNWHSQHPLRFPGSRMGIEQLYYDAFIRAEEYKAEWELYNAKSKKERKGAVVPRFNLEMEALKEILDTQRFITCHSYIQSEMNMLLHVADSMGFKVNTFTHALEGYKIADKLKKHGAAASTFSDWWAYKYEVNDAIPYNGAILYQQGVLTAFNSDDAEMGRRLNQEAAKAVKYGGLSEEEAWKFVTLNPAKILHLDHRMGSIKVGKDADLVVWNNNPLSVYARVEQTYIDGVAYFDIARDLELRKKILKERERIIAKMIREKKKGNKVQKPKGEKQIFYECDTLEE